MLRRCLLAVLLTGSLCAQQRIRVLAYNTHHSEGADLKIDLERIAKVIRAADPDLVALQEIDVRNTRSSGVDQARELACLTGLHVVFGRTISYRGGLYGNAVLSRWPIDGFVNWDFPFNPGREARAVIEISKVPVGAGAWFHFLATHLDTAEPDRLLAAAYLKKLVSERPEGWPMILAGDLNAAPGSRTINALLEDWTSADLGEPLFTFPAENPTRQIDFILFRPASRWKTVEVKVIDEPAASDHRPLLAVLELLP
jgi:endonuclease/exonuclease/phosphatase family metal-dependent hydrolase